jgi:hypothetical protein
MITIVPEQFLDSWEYLFGNMTEEQIIAFIRMFYKARRRQQTITWEDIATLKRVAKGGNA